MPATPLYHQDGKPARVCYCSDCKTIYQETKDADNCHCQPKICPCGAAVEDRHYGTCRKCRAVASEVRELDKFNAAEKLTEWTGPVYCDGIGRNDGYFPDIEELIDWLNDNAEDEEMEGFKRPDYAWICDSDPTFYADTDKIADNEDAPEGQYFSDCEGLKELEEACDKFNELNEDITTWTPNDKKCVFIPKLETTKE